MQPGRREQVWKSGRALGDPVDLAASPPRQIAWSHAPAHLQPEGKFTADVRDGFRSPANYRFVLLINSSATAK